MKIYGHPMSTCTRKVLMTLAENQTPHDFVLVDFAKGEHKQPAHMARQPFGQVPALDDDGFQLYESRAMCRYLNEKVRGSLMPADLRARAKAEQWISVETSNFTPHAMKYIYQYIFQRPQEPGVIDAANKQIDATLSVMDANLAKQQFFVGDNLSLADIMFMPYVEYGMATPLKDTITRHRHVAAWWSRVSERPTWRKIVGRG